MRIWALVLLAVAGCPAPRTQSPLAAPDASAPPAPLVSSSAAPDAGPPTSAPSRAVVVARSLVNVSGLALDDGFAYVRDAQRGLVRIPKTGGAPETVQAWRESNFEAWIAADGTDVFWATTSSDGTEPGEQTISRAPKTPKGGKPIVLTSARATTFDRVIVDEKNVYWIDGNAVMRVAKAGGKPARIAGARMLRVATYAIDDARVYWHDPEGKGALRSASLAGGSNTIVARPIERAWDLHVDATSAYWTEGEKIFSAPKAGGGAPVEIAHAPGPIAAIALDDTDVFFVVRGTGDDGRIARVAKTGGEITTLMAGQHYPRWIAIDHEHVFWASLGPVETVAWNGTLSMISKR